MPTPEADGPGRPVPLSRPIDPPITSRRLLDLLSAWETARRQGNEPTPEQLCPDDHQLREQLARGIALIRGTQSVSDESTTGPYLPVEPGPHAIAPLPQVPGHLILRRIAAGGM